MRAGAGRPLAERVFEPAPSERRRPTTLAGEKSPVVVGVAGKDYLRVRHPDHADSSSGVLCFTMPQYALAPNATCWGDLDTSQVNYRLFNTALSFFLFAIHQTVREDGKHARVFAEVVLHSAKDLPTRDLNLATMERGKLNEYFLADNIAGYRIWVLLPPNADSAETIMRRAVFRVQATLIPNDESGLLHAKIAIAAEVNPHRRSDPAVLERAAKAMADDDDGGKKKKRGRKHAAGKRRRKALVDGEAAEDDGDDDAEAPAPPRPVSADDLMEAFRYPPSNEMRTQMSSYKIKHPCNDYLRVTTVGQYITRVLGMHHVLTQLQKPDNNMYGAAELVEGEFGESADISAADPGRLAAFEVFSLLASNVILAQTGARGAADPKQTEPLQYGLSSDMQSGELTFPYPHLVWELGTHQLHPSNFLPSRFPWRAPRFLDEARRLMQAAAHQETQRKLASRPLSAPATTSTNRYAAVMFEEFTTNAHRQLSTRQEQAALDYRTNVAKDDEGIKGEFEVYSSPERMAAVVAANNLLADAQRHLVDEADCGDGSAVLTTISSPTLGLSREYRTALIAAVDAINRMQPPDKERMTASVWRQEQVNELHALYRSDLTNELLGVICNESRVPDSHRSMYKRLSSMGRFSAYYAPSWSYDRSITVVACAAVSSLVHISLACNLSAGNLRMDELLNATVLQAMDPELKDPLNMLIIGGPGSGKSHIGDLIAEASLTGALSAKEHSSKAADFTPNDRNFNTTNYSDEAKAIVTDMTRGYQLRNQEEMARTKGAFSNNNQAWDRYVTGPNDDHRNAEKQSIVAYRPRNHYQNANALMIDAKSDTALLDRLQISFHTPYAKGAVAPVERMTDSNAAQRKEMWCKMIEWIRQEMAVKAFWVIMSRAQVITVNMDVAELMLRESIADAEKYMPVISTSMRQAGRAMQVTSMMLFRSVYYQLMHSETSPLMHFKQPADVPKDYSLRDLYGENPHYLHEMAEVVGPYLYTQWDHGCWLLTSEVKAAMPFNVYMVLRAMAAIECGFRRAEFARIYRKHAVDLIDDDVKARMAGRTEDAREYPLFVRELLHREAQMDSQDLPNNDSRMPRFAESTSAAYDAHSSGASAESSTSSDPNYIEIMGTIETVATKAMSYINSFYIIESLQIASMLHLLKTKQFRVPVFQRVSRGRDFVTPDQLVFKEMKVDSGGISRREVVYEHRPVVVERIRSGGKSSVKILVGALMIPPHLMLLLMLTAAESKYTRPRTTTIPLEVEGHPELMHEWQIAAHPNRTLAAVDRSTPIQNLSEGFAATHATIELMDGDASGEGINIKTFKPHRVVDRDPEVAAFERHMRSLHQMPSYEWMLEHCSSRPAMQKIVEEDGLTLAPGDYPTERQYEAMFQLWIHTKTARPGGPEAKRDLYYREVKHLRESLSNRTSYPQAEIADSAVQRHVQTVVRRGPIEPIEAQAVVRELAADDDSMAPKLGALNAYRTNRNFMVALAHWLLLEAQYAHTMSVLSAHAYTPARMAIEWLACDEREIGGWLVEAPSDEDEEGYAAMNVDGSRVLSRHSDAFKALQAHRSAFTTSLRWFDLLAEWYAYHRKTRRLALVMTFRPDLDVLGAHALLPFNSWAREQRVQEQRRKKIRGKRLRGIALDAKEQEFQGAYLTAKNTVRALRLDFLHDIISTYKALIKLDAGGSLPPAIAARAVRPAVAHRRSLAIEADQRL